MPSAIRSIHSIGESLERIVDSTAWHGMAAKRLVLVGLTDGGRGYEMQRPDPGEAHVLVCYGGAGEVFVGQNWTRCATGQAYIAPARRPMGFRTVGQRRWKFAWAFLPAAADTPSAVATAEPSLSNVDPRPIVHAIEGLYLESTHSIRTQRLDLWGNLVSTYVYDLASGGQATDPLWQLWALVDARLAEEWTLDRLADAAGLSPEALRRLAIRTIGRSPMRQVAHLRMRRAETMLRSTTDKLYRIARQVGYDNAFAFSTAFSRWKGQSPSECRLAGHSRLAGPQGR
jgi:AraC-like DNA-binding protein